MTAATRPHDPAGGDSPAERSLGTRVSRGVGWSLGGQAVSRILVFGTGIVLARLLEPIDFGEVAAALAVTSVVMAINELGVIPALVRGVGDARAAAGTATTLALGGSCLAYLGAFLVAPWVAGLTNTPGSVGVIRVMALSVLVDGAIAVPLANLHRQLRTLPLVIAEVAGMVVYAGVALLLAAGFGIDGDAVALGRLAGSVVTGVLIAAAGRWSVSPGFDRAVARRLLSYGLPLAGSAAVFEAVLNVDYLMVGRELYGAALGMYLLAFNLSSWPVSIISAAIGRVSFAGYAALQGDAQRLERGFRHSVAVAVSATVPLVLIMMWLADELVHVIYGTAWAAAAPPLRWLLVLGGLRVLLAMVGEVLAVVGRVGSVLLLRLVWLIALPFSLMFGAESAGLRGVGMAHVAVILLLVAPLFAMQLESAGFALAPLGAVMVRPVAAGAVGAMAMWAVGHFVSGAVARLIVLASVGTLAYGAVLLPANPVMVRLWAQLRGRQLAGAAR